MNTFLKWNNTTNKFLFKSCTFVFELGLPIVFGLVLFVIFTRALNVPLSRLIVCHLWFLDLWFLPWFLYLVLGLLLVIFPFDYGATLFTIPPSLPLPRLVKLVFIFFNMTFRTNHFILLCLYILI